MPTAPTPVPVAPTRAPEVPVPERPGTERARAGRDPDVAAWTRNGRPERLVVLRPGTIALVQRGAVVRRLYPGPGAVTPGWLAANAGAGWITYHPGRHPTMRVRAAILLAPGSALQIRPADGTVLLSTGRTAASGTWIKGSRALLDLTGATLRSTGPGPARPYLAMGAGGRMDIVRSTVTGFGRAGPAAQSGVTWGRGSTGRAVASTFRGNRTGLRLTGSRGVGLDRVTVTGSAEDGVVLNGDRGTTVRTLSAVAGGRHGVVVGGTDGRVLTGVTTRANRGTGIKATAQRRLTLTRPAAYGDGGGGIRLMSCASCTVRGAVVGATPAALVVLGAGSRVTVSEPDLAGDGSGTGISLAAGIDGATVRGGRATGFARAVEVAGARVVVDGTALDDCVTGVAVRGRAGPVALRGLDVRARRFGITASGTTRDVSLTGVRIGGTAVKGLSSASPGLRVSGGSVTGARTAVDLRGSARLDQLTVSGARRGVHLAPQARVTAVGLDVLARRKGVDAEAGARLDLTDSRVRAAVALSGDGSVRRHGATEISLPPFPWLGLAALVALGLAVLLQTVHQVRHRSTAPPRVASHVRNTA
ncbi:right-handed parallel beta-helix repeat-containing protein [Streptomyces sp. NPDC046716]|uniref:right-handed parallel beta-helix repeat-containing protein n=1 Tax=Streptomyces sp. NPDC046716 TaxID=3157093 RepID=UPI0033D7E3F4